MIAVFFTDLPLDYSLPLAEYRVRRHANRKAFFKTAFLTLGTGEAIHGAVIVQLTSIYHIFLNRPPEETLASAIIETRLNTRIPIKSYVPIGVEQTLHPSQVGTL